MHCSILIWCKKILLWSCLQFCSFCAMCSRGVISVRRLSSEYVAFPRIDMEQIIDTVVEIPSIEIQYAEQKKNINASLKSSHLWGLNKKDTLLHKTTILNFANVCMAVVGSMNVVAVIMIKKWPLIHFGTVTHAFIYSGTNSRF